MTTAAQAALISELQADLVRVKAAIRKAQDAQSYTTPGGLTVAAGNLKDLYAERDSLQSRIQRLSGGRFIKTPQFGDAK